MLLWYLWTLRPNLRLLGQVILLELLGTSLALGALYRARKPLPKASSRHHHSSFVTIGVFGFLKEKQEGWEWLGLPVAVGGTLLLVFEPLLSVNHVAEFSV